MLIGMLAPLVDTRPDPLTIHDPLAMFRAAAIRSQGLPSIRWRDLSISLHISGHRLEHELARAMAEALLLDRLARDGDLPTAQHTAYPVAPLVASVILRVAALSDR